ncbi:hypothetical protein LCGC14_0929140 [marine sediment metagenome]|uniref:Uncharacterized protein n=1 Tax=marine sediment metagenome TaxID=412755 RepID=A0A0F9RV51_9ZZZZ
MITKSIIAVKYTTDGVYLSAKTDKGDYGQHYNTFDKTKSSFMPDTDTAIERFVAFYNQFERGTVQ